MQPSEQSLAKKKNPHVELFALVLLFSTCRMEGIHVSQFGASLRQTSIFGASTNSTNCRNQLILSLRWLSLLHVGT